MVKPAKVAVVMGSDSDFPTMKKCLKILKDFEIDYEAMVCSAHRTPDKAAEFARNADNQGFDIIIAAAGKAAHLAGVMAAHTVLPVIGIPINSTTLDGLDSLLSTVQMPSGIPVATVAVDGAENAALLAVQMLSIAHPGLKDKMTEYKKALVLKVEEKNKALQQKLSEI
jgi:5-(carboxyamino)imidazole ribonucleotide mutase